MAAFARLGAAFEPFVLAEAAALTLFGLFAREVGLADLLFRLDFADFGALATRFSLVLAAALPALAVFRAIFRAERDAPEGLRLEALLLAFAAFAARALLLPALLALLALFVLRVGIGAAAFKRLSSTGVDSSSPATRARAAPSDRAGADNRGDGNAAPAADLLAFVFMAINVWGWQPLRSQLELRNV